MLKDEEAPTVHQVEYILDNHMDTVILNNVPLKLGEVLAEERNKTPKVGFCGMVLQHNEVPMTHSHLTMMCIASAIN